MADSDFYCTFCGGDTGHLVIRERRLRICSICGRETKFKRAEKNEAVRHLHPYQVAQLKLKGKTIEFTARKRLRRRESGMSRLRRVRG